MLFFILGFCILLRALYQGYWKNRHTQQLFRVFIYTFFLHGLSPRANYTTERPPLVGEVIANLCG
jgi:hypothetical protein